MQDNAGRVAYQLNQQRTYDKAQNKLAHACILPKNNPTCAVETRVGGCGLWTFCKPTHLIASVGMGVR